MLAAFVTGFAKEASSMIDERNKEISDRALSEMEALVKKKAKADAAALERRDELRKQAAELRAYNVPEQQIVGMLESGYASIAIEKLKKAEVGTGDMKRLFTPFDPEDQRLVEDYIKTATTLTGTAPKAYLDEEGAFGLKTRAGTRVREGAARTVGVPLEELYKTDLPEMGTTPTGTLDLSMFAKEDKDSFARRKSAAQVAVLDAQTEEEKSTAVKTLGKVFAVEDMFKNKKDTDFNESNIRSNIRNFMNTINESMAGPGKSLVRIQEGDGFRYAYAKGTKKADIEKIERLKRTGLESYLRQFYSVEGEVPQVVRKVAEAFLATPGQRLIEPPASSSEPSTPPPLPTGVNKKIGVKAPDGKTYYFNTQDEADAFKKKAGIK